MKPPWILGLAALLALGRPCGHAAEPPATIVSPQITTNGVTFAYYDPSAFSVSVAGDFNQWNINSHLLQRSDKGLWTITVPLKPGKYQYQFNVNGIYWKHDPNNPGKVADNFGGVKSIVEVPQITAPAAAPVAETSAAPVPKPTKFTYIDAAAQRVALGGNFNRWNYAANPLTKNEEGVWETTVALKPGNHAYKLWVDGKWILDPANPVTVSDGYGGSASVKNVAP